MNWGMLGIFAALFIGYCLPFNFSRWFGFLNKINDSLVYSILCLIGIQIASTEHLFDQIDELLLMVGVFFISILLATAFAFALMSRWLSVSAEGGQADGCPKVAYKETLVVLGSMLLGLFIGSFHIFPNSLSVILSEMFLYILILILGIQLKLSGMTLQQALINKQGSFIALIVVVASMAGGTIAAIVLALPLSEGLAMSSGFGWYSLSGILMTSAYGPVMGATSFLLEVLREMTAFIFIPLMIRQYPAFSIGYGGATTLDFTLPAIQRQGGVELVPVAMVNGFLLSIAVPLLMAIFTHL